MSTAEIVAYLAGARIARDTIAYLREHGPEVEVPDMPFTDEEVAAKVRLGDEVFSRWVIRGSHDLSMAGW